MGHHPIYTAAFAAAMQPPWPQPPAPWPPAALSTLLPSTMTPTAALDMPLASVARTQIRKQRVFVVFGMFKAGYKPDARSYNVQRADIEHFLKFGETLHVVSGGTRGCGSRARVGTGSHCRRGWRSDRVRRPGHRSSRTRSTSSTAAPRSSRARITTIRMQCVGLEDGRHSKPLHPRGAGW